MVKWYVAAQFAREGWLILGWNTERRSQRYAACIRVDCLYCEPQANLSSETAPPYRTGGRLALNINRVVYLRGYLQTENIKTKLNIW